MSDPVTFFAAWRIGAALTTVAGSWPLQNPHHDPVNFLMEGTAGAPGRWITLRALRVLDWYATS